jgi:acetyl-CoA acetyltransferase
MPVRIAGVGASSGLDRPGDQLESLVFEAASGALADAGRRRSQVDGVCLAASDQLDGRPISSMQLAGPAGGFLKSEVKVGHDGIEALIAAALSIEAGVHETVLAVSWTKASESDWLRATALQSNPLYERQVGLHPLAAEGMLAGRFGARYGVDSAAAERLAAACRERAGAAAAEDAPLCWPLRGSLVPRPTDGAVALLLSRDEGDVEVAGLAFGAHDPRPSERRDPVAATAALAERAYAEAGGVDPRRTVIETTDRNAFRFWMSAIGLGFCAPGDDLAVQLAGEAGQRLNPGGGLWASNPVYAAGLQCVAGAVGALRGGAGEAIAHSSFGLCGNGDAVVVLRRAS